MPKTTKATTIPTQTKLKKALNGCAKNPRVAPYNVFADTATPDYIIAHSVMELRGENAKSVDTIRSVISNLGLALCALDPNLE